MASADLESAVLEMFAGLEADERLAGQGLAEAFAEAFPNLRWLGHTLFVGPRALKALPA